MKMTYEEFLAVIVESTPKDWIYNDEKRNYIFKNDLRISIIEKMIDYEDSGLFYEDWATKFPDNKARKVEFELCYNRNEIETFYMAYVDGMRMALPYPDLEDMSITKQQYQIGNIINIPNAAYGFDSYLSRANINVK